jgi:SP family xylose:H+ symportor-like MFS transporter
VTQSAPSGDGADAVGRPGFVTRVCLVAALGGLLFGYDTAVIAGAIGFLQEHFRLDPAMKGWAASSALLGCVLGVAAAGVFSDRLGRRRTLLVAAVLFLASAVGTAVPRSFSVFVLFRMLGGVGVGVASMASPMYIAEISPAAVRGRMVSVNQFAIISGMLIVYFVNYLIVRQGDADWNREVGWRWMFASGIVPSLVFLGLLAIVPESPRWLVENGQVDRAQSVLSQVGGPAYAAFELASIRSAAGATGGAFAELLRPGLRRALAVGVALAVLQQVTGINVFLYYAPEIFKQLGAGVDTALLQTIVVGVVNLGFTVVAIRTVDRWGRRPLMIAGAAGMGACLLAMGAAAQAGAIAGWVLLFVLGYIACFALSVGPVTWVLLSEFFPTRLRGRALSVATWCLWMANFAVSQTFPMLDGHPWLVERFRHGFPFYLYGACCALLVAVVWCWVPETRGRSLEEIEGIWTRPGNRS